MSWRRQYGQALRKGQYAVTCHPEITKCKLYFTFCLQEVSGARPIDVRSLTSIQMPAATQRNEATQTQ